MNYICPTLVCVEYRSISTCMYGDIMGTDLLFSECFHHDQLLEGGQSSVPMTSDSGCLFLYLSFALCWWWLRWRRRGVRVSIPVHRVGMDLQLTNRTVDRSDYNVLTQTLETWQYCLHITA